MFAGFQSRKPLREFARLAACYDHDWKDRPEWCRKQANKLERKAVANMERGGFNLSRYDLVCEVDKDPSYPTLECEVYPRGYRRKMRKAAPRAWSRREVLRARRVKGDPLRDYSQAAEMLPKGKDIYYRGMSQEEIDFIRRSGHILSSGACNFQMGPGGKLQDTCFGFDAETGAHYATGFATTRYAPTVRQPGYALAVRIPPENVRVRPGMGGSELEATKPVLTRDILGAVRFMVDEVSPGYIKINNQGRPGSSMRPDVSYTLEKLDVKELFR